MPPLDHAQKFSDDAVDVPAPTAVRWRIVALLMGLCFISHFNRVSMSVAGTDQIMDRYGIDPVRMGSVFSAFIWVYSICMIPGGVFIDRFGPRRALMVVGFGSAALGALTGAMGWIFVSGASLFWALAIVRGTMGAVSAPLHPAAARGIANWFPFPRRSFANGIVTAAAICGVAAAYPGFGALIKVLGWQGAFIVCAGLTATLTCIWAGHARDWPAQHPQVNVAEKALIGTAEPPRHEKHAWASMLLNRNLLLITFSYAAVGYFQYLFVYWMAYYFEKILHVSNDRSKVYAACLQVALAIGMPIGGWLSGRLTARFGVRRGRALVSGGGMFLSAALLALGVAAREPAWIVAWFALAHFAIGAAEGPFWATAVDIGGAKGGTSAAICNTGGNIGGAIAPTLTPWLGARFGWSSAIAVGGAVCIIGALCWCWIDPRKQDGQT